LKVTANKDGAGSTAAVNLYPQGVNFYGNVALRFSMYLSTYDFARRQPSIGTPGREFALFGLDHNGTNANWKPTAVVGPGTGASPTNNDGIWFAIDSGSGSLTPADFDAFSSSALPNGGTVDLVSAASSVDTGIFKAPPFTNDMALAGGSPANVWVEVDIEKAQFTNSTAALAAGNALTNSGTYTINSYIDRGSVLAAFTTIQNPSGGGIAGNWTNGTVMLGYEDPVGDVSDSTAFVYYSNVRMVELYPYLAVTPPLGYLITNQTSISLTNVGIFATVPGISNTWYKGNATAATLLQSDTNASTNITSTFTTNIATGTNIFGVLSDSAGAVTNVTIVAFIGEPTNSVAVAGSSFLFRVTAINTANAAAVTTYQWKTNGVNLVNGTKYSNVTTATLTISNVQSSDTLPFYTVGITNANLIGGTGFLTTNATLSLAVAPNSAVVSPASQTNIWGSSTAFTVTAAGTAPFTYGWKKGVTNLVGATKYSGTNTATLTISNLTQADAGSYTVGVTNGAGNTLSSPGVLAVFVPQPTISAVTLSGGNVSMNFTSTNAFDKSNSFSLLSATVVTGPYTNAVGALFSGSAGSFSVTVPQTTDSNVFYRLLHSN